jgi:peptide/nickel transport system substrate-binding protein
MKNTHIWLYVFFCLIIIPFLFVSCASKKDTIVIVFDTPPRSLDPHLKRELITLSILNNIYETLVGFDANMKSIPLVADYWEIQDSLTWIFYLREDILFHNGQECGVDDVIYSLYRPNDLPLSEFKQLQDVLDTIISMNSNEVLIKTRVPRTFLPYDLALIAIMPKGFNPDSADPIGTGPYKFIEVSDDGMALEVFSGYWGTKPEIERVHYRFVQDLEDRIKLFTDGKADIVGTIPVSEVNGLENIGRVVASAGNATRYLELNLRRYPFNKKECRLAINMGLDREKIATDVYYGYAVPANQFTEPGVFGYDPTREHFYYNPDSAKKLISRLGDYPVIVLDYLDIRHHIGETIAEQLRNIGLKIKTNPLTAQEAWERIENRISDCYLIANVPNSWEGIGDITGAFHTLESRRGLGLQNRAGYSNKKLDVLIESVPLIIDQQVVAEKMTEIQNILLEDMPRIPIVWEKFIYCVSERVDWTMRLDDFILVKDIRLIE